MSKKPIPDITPRYLNEQQACIYTSCGSDKLQEMRRSGLNFIQTCPNGSILYDRHDIDNFFSQFKAYKQ